MSIKKTVLSYIASGQHIVDEASLCILEENKAIPFPIKRVYYIFQTDPGAIRGKHAHKKTQQMLFCIQGSITVILDNGFQREEVRLDKPNEGIFLDVLMWHEMKDFTPDTILLVFASDYYKESDYIRSYNEFINYIKSYDSHE